MCFPATTMKRYKQTDSALWAPKTHSFLNHWVDNEATAGPKNTRAKELLLSPVDHVHEPDQLILPSCSECRQQLAQSRPLIVGGTQASMKIWDAAADSWLWKFCKLHLCCRTRSWATLHSQQIAGLECCRQNSRCICCHATKRTGWLPQLSIKCRRWAHDGC